MKIEIHRVLRVLALGLDNSTPNHRIGYLLGKLFGLDGLGLDKNSEAFYERIRDLAQKMAMFAKD